VSHSLVALSTLAPSEWRNDSFAALVAVIAYPGLAADRFLHFLAAGVPYAIAGGGMLLYALQDWTGITAQFFHNTHGRFGFLSTHGAGLLAVPA